MKHAIVLTRMRKGIQNEQQIGTIESPNLAHLLGNAHVVLAEYANKQFGKPVEDWEFRPDGSIVGGYAVHLASGDTISVESQFPTGHTDQNPIEV